MITTKALRGLADRGDADSQFRLGYRLAFSRNKRGRDLRRAARYWKLAAAQGHARAQFYLGTLYDDGRGIGRSTSRAMAYYALAARQGHSAAQYNLALGHRDGDGVPRKPTVAVHWLRCAANSGDAAAQRDLGYCLHEGIGTRRSYSEAALCYRRAARQGVDDVVFWGPLLIGFSGPRLGKPP